MLCGLWASLCFGNLNNGTANAGLFCENGNNALSNANWNILARLSFKLSIYLIKLYYVFHAAAKIDSKAIGPVAFSKRSMLSRKDFYAT